jgi:hypothetical protein
MKMGKGVAIDWLATPDPYNSSLKLLQMSYCNIYNVLNRIVSITDYFTESEIILSNYV